ncbi:MAG: IS30 family transposase [Nocardioides sp.]|nr:IS30 family transposase [Nocardioides sp.]
MGGPGQPRLPKELELVFWSAVREGLTNAEAAALAGVSEPSVLRWFRQRGGVLPPPPRPAGSRPRLSLEQREEIAILRAQDLSNAEIARRVGVHRSTIGRELAVGSSFRPHRRPTYRASVAQAGADRRASRGHLPGKLARNPALAALVTAALEDEHSPEQIAARLKMDFPDDEDMHVSHEVIYQALYVQGRGELRRDLHKRLRTGRTLRKPRRAVGQRRAKMPGMVSIAERPPEVEDRAVPGHWEGDLIVGAHSKSAIGTLVERTTGFVALLHLPQDHGADAVAEAMIEAMSRLPEILRKTLTWDQGSEMANHVQIAAATDLDIYFCDPHSPWQRGTNENTNGLLRQYFPKGTDLSVYAPDYLEHVARKLNNRPRKRLGFKTPAEVLDELLSQPHDPHGVASTA